MRALRWALTLMMLVGLGAAANGAEVAIPPSPTQWATDKTGFLTAQTVRALDARLRAYESSSGHQVLVYVLPTTGDTPTEDWTVRAFARWKVGRKGLDDGLILFVFPTDRKLRIEVGYGLEQKIPDATAARIIHDITPKLKAGNSDAAVTAGIDEILSALGGGARGSAVQGAGPGAQGKNEEGPRGTTPPDPVSIPADSGSSRFGDFVGVSIGVLIGLVVVVGIIVLIMKLPDPPKGAYISSRRSGFGFWDVLNIVGSVAGGFAGGGGFSGGGGMSGGGGATGSW
jgi:uncharacterized protein